MKARDAGVLLHYSGGLRQLRVTQLTNLIEGALALVSYVER